MVSKIAAAYLLCAGLALSQKPDADKAVFEAVCGACHPSAMAEDIRTQAEWKETVDLMVNAGAKGTPDQFKAIWRSLLNTWTKVNVNSASAAEIAPVLAVNEATAEAIVKRRADKGAFKTIEELKSVPGVDAAKLDERKDRIKF
jgi:competence protein ComEA